MKIRWLKRALKSFEVHTDYIAKDNPKAAYNMSIRILEALENLKLNPGMGRAGRVPGTRELTIPGTPYLIPYRVINSEIQVLHVLHGAQLWPQSF